MEGGETRRMRARVADEDARGHKQKYKKMPQS